MPAGSQKRRLADDDERQRLDRRLAHNGLRPEPRRCSACLWATTVIFTEVRTAKRNLIFITDTIMSQMKTRQVGCLREAT
eukprot:scaffold76358_cov41-Attheya_sp.AAC.2